MQTILTYGAVLSSPYRVSGLRRKTTLTFTTTGMDVDEAFETRLSKLRDAVTKAFNKLDALYDADKKKASFTSEVVNAHKPLYVFVAPEWFFRVEDELSKFDEGRYFGRTHRDALKKALITLSTRDNAHVLVVAGSMLFIEPKDTSSVARVVQKTEKYDARKKEKYEAQQKNRSLLRTETEAQAREARLGIATNEKTSYLGYNEAFAAFDGTIVKKVLKSANSGDFETMGGKNTPGDEVSMVFGLGAGVFDVKVESQVVRVGLAICFDHSRVRDYGKTVDLYILVSCSQSLTEEKYVRDGGLVLHADCRNNWSGIHAGTGNTSLEVTEEQDFSYARTLLRCE